jgi:hypothetical protein
MNSQLRAPVVLPPGKDPGTHWIRGWVGPRAGLDAVAKRKIILFAPTGNRTQLDSIKTRNSFVSCVAQTVLNWRGQVWRCSQEGEFRDRKQEYCKTAGDMLHPSALPDSGQVILWHYSYSEQSRDSSVGIALGYGPDDWGSRFRFPTGAGNFPLHHRVQNVSGAQPASYSRGTRGSFPGDKAAGAWSWPLTSI